MRKIIYRTFWAWNFDKEEAWLNDMAAKGLSLVSIGFCCYVFEETTPGKYNIRLELLENLPTHPESQQYINFIEETGAEYLGSLIRWVYFRKQTNHGSFSLYSDYASRIKYLNRVLALIGAISIPPIGIGLINIATGTKPNFIMGISLLCLGLFLVYGFLQVYHKKRALRQQQHLFE